MAKRRYRNIEGRYLKERQRNLLAKPGEFSYRLVLDHLKAGHNVAKIFRTAEAFGAQQVHLVGIGVFDPAAAKGAFRKVPAVFHDEFKNCHDELIAAGYTLYRLEPGSVTDLWEIRLPEKCAFILGHEEFGFSFEKEDFPEIKEVRIPHSGTVQSLNVSVAGAIVMYEYLRQQKR